MGVHELTYNTELLNGNTTATRHCVPGWGPEPPPACWPPGLCKEPGGMGRHIPVRQKAGMEEPGTGSAALREGRPAKWHPGGPPGTCGQGIGAFFMAAMNTHLSLQLGLNHLDRKTSNLDLGWRCFVFLAN